MGANLIRFRARSDLVARDTAALLADQLREMPEAQMPLAARAALLNALQRVTHPDTEQSIWAGGFFMLSRTQTELVWDAIRRLPASARPNQVRHAFDLVVLNLRQDTGEVMLTRDDFSKRIGTASRNISTIMGTLETMGVLRRERRRIDGVQGRGQAVYFINPHVGWNGSLEVRKDEAAETPPPLLTLMQGGRSS
jgi:hypothetical protein